ncbi:hypothetical protein P153DRAFT_394692 [Dothidotthia symphoricarpi CBS 119687]|uniref:Uncharacterized protein n=1 Tax=Dothidotthia symphoricarpi CBS 119687 TaxID=1392245 RepID=A0A6A6AJR9_9PLEO|nr:uncharacterized protein P153DRAFT_394692 [Dothidotthia symphoricarpi CBS 119687]KAF2131345.1 hypothetical protein P153DRAFT_394692 [Dothidotthia symphoricarpi CBS 119687]
MAPVDDVSVINRLKELILDLIRLLYGSRFTIDCTFSVNVNYTRTGYHPVALVAIPVDIHHEYELLDEGEMGASEQQALELFYRRWREHAEQMAGGMLYLPSPFS